MINTNIDPTLNDLITSQEVISGLVQFSKEVLGQTNGLYNVLLLSKPDQLYPEKASARSKLFIDQLKDLKLTSLIDISREDEKIANALMRELIKFIKQTPDMVNQKNWLLPNSVRSKVKAFESHSSRAVMSRILLQQEGIVISPASFCVSPKALGEHLSSCQSAGETLKNVIVDEVTFLVIKLNRFINKLKKNNRPNQFLIDQVESLESSLVFAKAGKLGSLEKSLERLEADLASCAEAYTDTLDSSKDRAEPENSRSAEIDSSTQINNENKSFDFEQDSKPSKTSNNRSSLIAKSKKWLNSSWDVKWRDL